MQRLTAGLTAAALGLPGCGSTPVGSTSGSGSDPTVLYVPLTNLTEEDVTVGGTLVSRANQVSVLSGKPIVGADGGKIEGAISGLGCPILAEKPNGQKSCTLSPQ